MKKSKIILIVISVMLLLFIFISCMSKENNSEDNEDNIYIITKDMSKEEVDQILGDPIDEIGFGLTVFVYRVGTSSSARISFNGEGKIVGGVLQKSDGTEEVLFK